MWPGLRLLVERELLGGWSGKRRRYNLNVRSDPATSQRDTAARAFIVAWVFSLAFYFLEYAVRSSPAVMIPQLAKTFNVSALGVSGILGRDYYTYTTATLDAGIFG